MTSQTFVKSRRPNDSVMKLFEELSSTYPQMYISLILGMSKHSNPKGAFQVYQQAREQNLLRKYRIISASISNPLPPAIGYFYFAQ